ncbi:MAG: hypothetical protein NZ656_09410, partial [Nitrospinaceae bacterium]|nr:hypothetical protein [Nitrospinaceae bacterium]
DRIYLTDRKGQTLVIRHDREPKMLSLNNLKDSFSASPAILGDALFLRGEKFLYCLSSAGGG